MGAKGSLWINNEGVLKAEPAQCEKCREYRWSRDSMVAGLIYGFEKVYRKQKL